MAQATIHYDDATTTDEHGRVWRYVQVVRTDPPGCLVRWFWHDGGLIAEAAEGEAIEMLNEVYESGFVTTVRGPVVEGT